MQDSYENVHILVGEGFAGKRTHLYNHDGHTLKHANTRVCRQLSLVLNLVIVIMACLYKDSFTFRMN